jgi:hypothetical protein
LAEIGPHAKAALPIFEQRLAKAKANLAAATESGQKKMHERQVRHWEGVIRKANASH